MPEEAPSVHERPDRAVRGRAAKAWDLFMSLNETEIELRASHCRHQVRFAGKSKRVQLRMAAGALWKKFDKHLKEAYAIQAELKKAGARDSTSGKFCTSGSALDAEEPGISGAVAEDVHVVSGAVAEDEEPPVRTPKKRSSS